MIRKSMEIATPVCGLVRNDREFDNFPICQTAIERYRAAQGRNDYTYLAHDLAARPAGKFQFAALPREAPDDTLCFLPSYTYRRGNAREISRSQIGAEVLTIYSRQSREIRYNRSYQTNQNSGPVPEEKKGRIHIWLFLF